MRVIWKEPNSRAMIRHIDKTLSAIQGWVGGDPLYLDRSGHVVFLGHALADQNGEDLNGFEWSFLENVRGRVLIIGYPEDEDFGDVDQAVQLWESLTEEDVKLWLPRTS